ncbi:MAG: T9SS type A sorting domain-containing protein [Bacteroidota bacterium]
MKKNLFLVCGLVIGISAMAQNKRMERIVMNPDIRYNMMDDSKNVATGPVAPVERKTPLVITNNAITDIVLGKASNLLGGLSYVGRSVLDYNSVLNTLILTHRSNPATDNTVNSGAFMVDISKDGGSTWTSQQGPVSVIKKNGGRYPQGFIVNPTGNTNPDNAFVAVHGANHDGAMWGSYPFGTAQIGSIATGCMDSAVFNSGATNFRGLIPNAGVITANNTIWIVDKTYDGTAYSDTIILRKGTFATNCVNYTTTKIPFTVTATPSGGKRFNATNIAFSANGQTGYLSVFAHNDYTFEPDSTNYLIVWKTTDGGNTWGAGISVGLDCIGPQLGYTGGRYGHATAMDGTVDMNGNLHLIFAMGSYDDDKKKMGEFATYTTDGGTTWKIQLLDEPMSLDGIFGDTTGWSVGTPKGYWEDNRGQVALSLAGDKVFYVWFDTDTIDFTDATVLGNIHPNAIVKVYDVATGNWEPKVNLTKGTAGDGLVTFGYVAYWAGGTTYPYTLHIGYQAMTGDQTAPVDFHYLKGVEVPSGTGVANTACTPTIGAVGVPVITSDAFSVSSYPNPASDVTTIAVNMLKSEKVSVEITNILGQVIYNTSANLPAGEHKFNVNVSKWNSGVYFYTVKSNDFSVTNKIIVE